MNRIRSVATASAVAFFAILLLVPTAARAQGGAILVRVSSASGGPISAATVELLDGQRVARAAVTDTAGVARLVGIPGGSYQVRTRAIGHRDTVVDVTLAPGSARVVTVVMEAAPVELEGIAVRSSRVQIERQTTEFGSTVGEVAIEMLPVAYDANQLVALTPGARPDHVWGGANFQANSYQIDGLSANHPGLGGSIIQPSTNWIERIDVRGLGAGAEHGGFQGGQVDITTKSGSNEFAAMLRSSLENELLSASNLVSTEIGSEVATRYDVEGEVQGAVVRDRLFYYLGATLVEEDSRALNHMGGVEGRYSPFMEERRETRAFGKLTWRPGTGDQLELSGAHFGTDVRNYATTGYEAEGATTSYESPTWFANLAWRRSLGEWAELEARVNHFARDERQESAQGTDRPGIRFFALLPPFTTFGNAPFSLRSAPASTSANVAGTFRFRLLGEDQMVKVGADYTRGHFIDRRVRNGGMTWLPIRTGAFDPAVPATWTHTSASFMPTEWGGEVDLDAEVVNAAGYAQAAFSVGPLTLSPGVRWGFWQGSMNTDAGALELVEDNALDPRIGAMVELVADGSMVLKGHWGRYHQDMIAQMFDRAAGTDVFNNQEIWYYWGEPPTDPGDRFTLAQRDSLAALGLFTRESVISLNETGPVADYDQPYIDQWLVGFEKQFGQSVKVEALYTRRTNHDMIALVDRNAATNYIRYERVRVYDATGPLPFEGGTLVLSELYVPTWVAIQELKFCAANPDICGAPPELSFSDTLLLSWNPDYTLTNAPDARREFDQFQFTVEVARPRWGGSFSVAVTGLQGNLDNVSGYADPAQFSPGPYVRVNEGVNAFGTLPNFSEREAKVSAWGMLPWDLRGGIFWTYSSGDHYSPQFRLSGMGFYSYEANATATRGGNYQNPGETAGGDPLPLSFFVPLEGHHVYVGPRGLPQHQRRANIDLRLERRFERGPLSIGVSLDAFNIIGAETVTAVQTMTNNGRNFYYFLPPNPATPWARIPENQYYDAPLGRVPPRRVRLGATVYF